MFYISLKRISNHDDVATRRRNVTQGVQIGESPVRTTVIRYNQTSVEYDGVVLYAAFASANIETRVVDDLGFRCNWDDSPLPRIDLLPSRVFHPSIHPSRVSLAVHLSLRNAASPRCDEFCFPILRPLITRLHVLDSTRLFRYMDGR